MSNVVQFPNGKPRGEEAAPKKGERQKKKRKVSKVLVRFVTTVLSLILILGAAILVIFHDQLNVDSLKRYLTYQNLEKNEKGQAEEIFFENNNTNCFAQLDNSLIVCSATSLQLYSQSGTEYVTEAVAFSTPAVFTSGSYGVAYDLGGTSYYVFAGKAIAYQGTAEGSILCARVNENGYLTIVSQATGYKGTATVYDSGGEPMVKENLSSAYVTDAQVSNTGKTLALVTIGEEGGVFLSTVNFYSVSSGELISAYQLEDQVVLDLNWDSNGLWTQTDHGVSYLTVEQGITGQWLDDDSYLRGFTSGGDGYQAMVFTTYRNGTRGEVVLVDKTGQKLASVPVSEEVLSISANEDYLAVLYTNRMEIYTNELELYASLDDTAGARQVMMRRDGAALLIGSESASIYLP